ncbi:tRNA-uridine aminocarboxypropyltransferase [Massilia sp. R2A-15]|uniref:tRNA-uridine aminocarboxypropyltransferase n=1 Tax=Massilia sp. R2A-15 TaxID=3064278 RepID=UPI002732E6CB|nr:tRNA-uridine aminocarboxypropyltransferase [Massilia sp. R2A-15]WLI87558.1 tRNA-uridine aminocarboxypropyltransferase [Massilia sp. R2A-15]
MTRPTCSTCLRPQATCICRWIAPTAAQVEVLILQHPLEVHNAKGSARLLHLSLPGSVMVTGEAFDPDELAALLYAGGRSPVLLYPGADHPAEVCAPSNLRLVVLDGTWRKSRKMLHLNPLLQTLPRLALEGMPESHYRIRKAHAPNQLSSMEATVYALMRLEGSEAPLAPLLAAFDGFVDQQASYASRGLVPRT